MSPRWTAGEKQGAAAEERLLRYGDRPRYTTSDSTQSIFLAQAATFLLTRKDAYTYG